MSMLKTIPQQEDSAVAIGLDDALLGWLVESAGDRLVRWLRGDPARTVMCKVVEQAISETVDEVVGGTDPHTAEHLRAALLGRDLAVDSNRVRVTSESELRDALHAWTAALDLQADGGDSSQVLWWSLALGADLGGNATAIGASANVVVLGLAERAGKRISFWQFTKYGLVRHRSHGDASRPLSVAALLRAGLIGRNVSAAAASATLPGSRRPDLVSLSKGITWLLGRHPDVA